MNNDARIIFFNRLGKYFQAVSFAMLALTGFFLKTKLENDSSNIDVYLIIFGILTVVFLIIGPIFFYFEAKASEKTS